MQKCPEKGLFFLLFFIQTREKYPWFAEKCLVFENALCYDKGEMEVHTMSNSKKILVIGGTGAMGVYLVPLLAEMGCLVDVPSLELPENSDPSIRYFKAD